MNDIIRANVEQRRKMMAMGLKHWVVVGLIMCAAASRAAVPDTWTQPASALAEQVASILGPGQAHLVLHNISTISNDQLPALRKLFTQDLKAHGVTLSGAESANTIRITLSETETERLLVAEVLEGSTSQIAIVRVRRDGAKPAATAGGILLRSQAVIASDAPVLAALEQNGSLVIAEPDAMTLYIKTGDAWQQQRRFAFVQRRGEARDPRGVLAATSEGFEARIDAVRCEGAMSLDGDTWPVHCAGSDDPWPLTMTGGATQIKAFYNAARNSFTGVVTPNVGADLPAFYSAALLPRAAGNGALLVGGVDGKLQLVENNALKNVSGARDWGSDFAILNSGCGAGTQIIASASGAAASDSLRAYELPALEAVPVSAPLAVQGAVTALWSAPDGKSVYAVVRGAEDRYEVDRVTALCN
jgi:hypothetical protein